MITGPICLKNQLVAFLAQCLHHISHCDSFLLFRNFSLLRRFWLPLCYFRDNCKFLKKKNMKIKRLHEFVKINNNKKRQGAWLLTLSDNTINHLNSYKEITRSDQQSNCFSPVCFHSLMTGLRKQSTFHDATTGFPAKWSLRNGCRNSILVTHHYPDLGSALPRSG